MRSRIDLKRFIGGPGMEFREIQKSDDPIIARIIRDNLKAYSLDIPGTAYFDEHLDHLSDYYLGDKTQRFYCIALEGDEIIGGIGMAAIDLFDDCAELQKLYLSDSAKGRGYGYILIQRIEDKARELGFARMYLETHTNLEAAIHEYQKAGYIEIEKPAGVIHSAMNKFFIKAL